MKKGQGSTGGNQGGDLTWGRGVDWQVNRGASPVQAPMQGCRARRRGHYWTDTG